MTQISQEQLAAIWAALNDTPQKASPYGAARIMRAIAADGWMYSYQMEDLAYAMDGRLVSHRHGMDLEKLSEAADCHWAMVFPRPRVRSINVVGSRALHAADAASFLMYLERLGFAVDPGPLIALLRPTISKKTNLTNAELTVFWAAKSRGKSSTTLEVEGGGWRHGSIKVGKLANGYRYETWLNDDGSIYLLNVKGPKHRHQPKPKETVCPECAYTWWKGDPDSSASHREEHKKRMKALDPRPLPTMLDALASGDLDADVVTSGSPKWKHEEIYRRASAFRREMGFDFVQWDGPDGDDDPNVHGFLMIDENKVIVGAAAFRWRELDDTTDPPFWGLQWVWVCPRARRSGVLSRYWDRFRQRFGAFWVEAPVSDDMQAFLHARGEVALMEWPSQRGQAKADKRGGNAA